MGRRAPCPSARLPLVRGFVRARRAIPTCCAVLAALSFGACEGSSGGEGPGARVTRVIDGDTVEMERLGKVRLIGVDTPETGRCGDDAATRFTRDRLEGQVVQYEVGVEPKDRYDRTLAYLSREGDMHNLALLSEGYARVLTIRPNDKYESRFERAEREARTADAGLNEDCDRDRIRARRAEARREKEEEAARRVAAAERRTVRRARRVAREQAREAGRSARTAARRQQRQAEEQSSAVPDDSGGGSSGGGADTSGPSTTNYCGKRDGDGDGIYCE